MAVHLTVNGADASAVEGDTILEVARKEGIDIPHLCDYEGHANGACRLCVVEADSKGRAVPSCSTRVREGMAIRTDTPHLDELRKGILSLLLDEHGAHEGAHECQLEAYGRRYGLESRHPGRHGSALDASHPAILFNPDVCILCRKCVVACNDDQVHEVLSLAGRGGGTRISFGLGVALGESDCASCGACVDACPTDALIEKGWGPAERTVVTTCPYCGVGCTVEYGVSGGRIVRARGVGGSSVNRGKLCVKGKFAFQHEASEDRLRTPLIRREGVPKGPLLGRDREEVFRTATWPEALDLVAERIRTIRDAHGTAAIAGIASDRSTNEDIFAFQKFMRAAVGTDNVDQSATLCHAPSAAMLSWALGAGASTNPVDDLGNARTILLVGSNTERAHPVIAASIKRAAKDGAHLIIVDPRRLEIGRFARLSLNLRPGTDVVLFSAMAKVILDNGWEDRAFIATRTEGFEAWAKALEPFDLEAASRVTGVPADDLRLAAALYAREGPSVIFWTLGITEHENGSDNVSALVNLALLTGNVGKAGAGLNPIRGQNNVQGGADMGSTPGSLPGYQSLLDPAVRATFEARWGRPLPEAKGWKSTEMIQLARGRLVRMLYISGENSVRSHPDSGSVAEAFGKLDFLVVQDLYLTETAEYADVILPAASSFEKAGTFTNTERRVQVVRRVFDPPGEARADWEIYADLASRLGYPMGYAGSQDIMEEIADLAPAYAGIRTDRLEVGGLQWPIRKDESAGTPILHMHEFVRGRGRFRPVAAPVRRTEPEREYPFVLITGRQREQYHTGTMTRRSPVIERLAQGPVIEMNPDDMRRDGLSNGDRVRMVSSQGAVEASVVASPSLPVGVIFTTFHYAELPVNVLTPPTLDPITKTPAYKDTRVRVEKVG